MTGYQGQLLLRRAGRAQRPYALMLLANTAAAMFGYALLREGTGQLGETLAFVSIGAFVFLVMIPPLLRDLARRALERDRLGIAQRLLSLRELLQPGLGARQEREDVEMFAAVRSGRVDEMLVTLRARLAQAERDPALKSTLDERVVLLFLYARRWSEAIDHFESTLGQGGHLGSPQLLVELVRAYLEEGSSERAAELLEILERSPMSRQAIFVFLLMRARMVFLAFLGRVGEVEMLLAPAGPLGMLPPAVRAYWTGIARYHAGDGAGARDALRDALRLGARDARAREVASEKLAAIEAAGETPPPVSPPPEVQRVADRVLDALRAPPPGAGAASALPRLEGSVRKLAPVTAGIVVANLAVALALVLAYGWTAAMEDAGVLSLAGANIKEEVQNGAWWRLHASTFLHVGILHLGLNMYMLLVLGKLVEQIFGGWRMFALYSVAGVAGSLASYLFGQGAISLGASGAVFGVLGAAISELALRRRVYPETWRRVLLGNLIFVAVANLAIGWAYAQLIDQSAHLGGFVAGGLCGVVFSRRAAYGKSLAVRVLAATLVVASFASLAYSAWGVSTSIFRTTWKHVNLGGLELDVPPTWMRVHDDRSMFGPHLGTSTIRAEVKAAKVDDLEAVADEFAGEVSESLTNEDKVSRVEPTPATIPAPPGWATREHRVEADLGDENRTAFRHILYVKLTATHQIEVTFFVPEARLSDLAKNVPKILASARVPAATP
jgi:membrane associated rhomboid family serine protease